ncbi:MAG: oligopeptidase B, partial [Acidimicrobiia bacterium]
MLDQTPTPPRAKRVPHVHEAHGDRRNDDYHWMRNREDPDVTAYLEAENAYTEAVMAPTKALQERVYTEIVGRIQETDLSVAVPHGPFRYYSRSVEGLQYHVYCRRPDTATEGEPGAGGVPEDGEEVLLDHNAEAEGHEYCEIGLFEVTPDHRLLAWSIDTAGDEEYLLHVRDLETGADLPDAIPGTYYGAAWASDNVTLFYSTIDDAHRPWRIWRHRLGTDPAQDVLVHQEDDERFFASVARTRSGGFILIDLHSATTSEVRVVDAGDPEGDFRIVEPRRQDVEYSLDHHGERFFILANDDAPNFRLVEAPVADPGRHAWQELIPHRPDIKLEGIDALAGHLVVLERADGVRRLRVRDLGSADEHLVDQPEAVSRVGVSEALNPGFHTTVLRYTYT